jgi:uncharacterized membrane protein YraQ (UPF0718 family)
MADLSQNPRVKFNVDKVWLVVIAIPLVIALFDPAQAVETVSAAANSMKQTGIFILFAVLAVGYLKASGAETLLARAFEGPQMRMVVMAALLGGLSPFCSCEVIPFIAALLAVGAPLSAVMAFWLSSPLMDPAMFSITAGELGLNFALAKTVAAVGIGLLGGVTVMAFAKSPVFADPLKERPKVGGCCGVKAPFQGKPDWAFWGNAERRVVFRDSVIENALFLGKWLALAYLLEALMVRHIPAEWIAQTLGGEGFQPILLGALVGMPAYLNGYAAVGLVDGMLAQGMALGAAMSFVLAGGVSCVPAAVAVWALVKPRVFTAYLAIALIGSLIAGILWSMVAI